MNSSRRFLAALLLGVFALIVVPKSWWHDCGHDYSAHHFNKGISKGEKPCAICDLHFSPYVTADQHVASFSPEQQHKQYFFHLTTSGVSATIHYLLRGPPAELTL